MLPVVQEVAGMGTPWGWSFWSSWRDCPEQAKRHQPSEGLCGIPGFDVGTIAHALTAHYYRRAMTSKKQALTFDTSVIEWSEPEDLWGSDYRRKVIAEGDRMFRAYRLRYPPDDLGKIVAVEEMYQVDNFLGLGIPYTLRPDVEVSNPPGYPKRGRYLVDHKFYAFASAEDAAAARDDLRFKAYQRGYTDATGITPAGLIVNIAYKSKVPTFDRILVSPPSKREIDSVKRHLETCRNLREAALTPGSAPITNINHCRRWGQKPCPHLLTCKR